MAWRADRSLWAFATAGLALAAISCVGAVAGALGAFDRSKPTAETVMDDDDRDDGAVADPNADAITIVRSAADAMAAVTSVEFRLNRDGAAIYVDEFERIALDRVRGQFSVPTRAQAELDVTVNGNMATKLGAVAIDSEIWISNPVTGQFETLPAGYDIDPSRFFDPEGGWRPLLANLGDVTLVAIDDRGGERYHVRGVAPAEQVRNITVGLVRDQDVAVDLWIHPATFHVTAAEFDTEIGGETARWQLELTRYGDEFLIEPPASVRGGSDG